MPVKLMILYVLRSVDSATFYSQIMRAMAAQLSGMYRERGNYCCLHTI